MGERNILYGRCVQVWPVRNLCDNPINQRRDAAATHAEVLAAHGGSAGLREAALLESAVAAPQATMTGEPLFSDAVEIGVAYLFYLCRNHPFVDGNKRTALATCLVFLSENDLLPGENLEVEAWEALE